MRKSLLLLLLAISPVVLFADQGPQKPGLPFFSQTSVRDFSAELHHFGHLRILKVSPSFYGIDFKGGAISFETGVGIWPLSINTSLRYFSGTDAEENVLPIEPHIRLEIQPRLWGVNYMRGIFIAPVVNIYDDLGYGFGGVFGYQHFLTKTFTVETFVGVQSSTKSENYDSPIFLRYGLSFGFAMQK